MTGIGYLINAKRAKKQKALSGIVMQTDYPLFVIL